MLREIHIEGFRALSKFRLTDLGRINLLVGTNNCGKTSVLEAIEALVWRGDFSALVRSARRRGELVWEESESRPSDEEVDICHLFHGHVIEHGSNFSIRGLNDSQSETFTASILEGSMDLADRQAQLHLDRVEELPSPLTLTLDWNGQIEFKRPFPISRRGGVPLDYIVRASRRPTSASQARLITTSSMTSDEVTRLFDEIVLTEEENSVVRAIQVIDPSIERVATIGRGPRRYVGVARGGFGVKLTGVDQRVPIGSMGDGIWRMLGLAVALVHSENGVLLVDEIDTGLHYTVMEDMWRLVAQTAARLNLQVFATTHSRDCFESLASVLEDGQIDSSVTIQRLERGSDAAVPYARDEIVAAASRNLEVR